MDSFPKVRDEYDYAHVVGLEDEVKLTSAGLDAVKACIERLRDTRGSQHGGDLDIEHLLEDVLSQPRGGSSTGSSTS